MNNKLRHTDSEIKDGVITDILISVVSRNASKGMRNANRMCQLIFDNLDEGLWNFLD